MLFVPVPLLNTETTRVQVSPEVLVTVHGAGNIPASDNLIEDIPEPVGDGCQALLWRETNPSPGCIADLPG